ncbi:hypothetical protein FACS189472_00210 [Alphaproteobacteria bacterium]|nr:hypothetical protein FACS189472_00210 [Alphaproteobacteria bacterium]
MKEDEIRAGLADAKAEGAMSKAKETALSMLADNMPVETISKYTGLLIKEISALQK